MNTSVPPTPPALGPTGHRLPSPVRFIAAILIVACAIVSVAHAEDSYDRLFQPTLSRQAFEAAAPSLGLSADQETVLRSLFDAYDKSMSLQVAASRAQLARLESGEAGSWEDLNYRWFESQAGLDDKLESDANAALEDPAALARWQSLMAAVRRRLIVRELQKDARERHACDPLALLQDIPLTEQERTDLADELHACEREMDEAIRRLMRLRASLWQAINESRREFPMRPDGTESGRSKPMQEALAKREALWTLIVQLGVQHYARIAAALGEHRQDYINAADRSVYPEAFAPCPAELALEALRMAEGVSPEQLAAAQAVFDAYKPAREELSRTIAHLARQWEEGDDALKRQLIALSEQLQTGVIRGEDFWSMRADLASHHPAIALLNRKHDMALDALRQMRSAFTDGQLQHLPLNARLCLAYAEPAPANGP